MGRSPLFSIFARYRGSILICSANALRDNPNALRASLMLLQAFQSRDILFLLPYRFTPLHWSMYPSKESGKKRGTISVPYDRASVGYGLRTSQEPSGQSWQGGPWRVPIPRRGEFPNKHSCGLRPRKKSKYVQTCSACRLYREFLITRMVLPVLIFTGALNKSGPP